MRGTAIALVGAMMLIGVSSARADGVSTRARQLRNSSEYKVRLSAALWLAKKRDRRAIAALAYAVRKDSEYTVRRVAALSLGKLLDESVPARYRDAAIAALAYAAKRDSNKKVRRTALRVWRKVRALRAPDGGLPAVFVAVGNPSGKRVSKRVVAQMQVTMRRALREAAPGFGQATAGDGLPTKKQLEEAGSAGFYVNASVRSLTSTKKRGYTETRCKVGMSVNAWNGKDGEERFRENETASATGKGHVKAASTRSAIANAQRDCVSAVVEQLTERQIVPFIKRQVETRVAVSDD